MAIPPQVIMMAAQLMQQRQQKLAAKKQKLVSELPDIAPHIVMKGKLMLDRLPSLVRYKVGLLGRV